MSRDSGVDKTALVTHPVAQPARTRGVLTVTCADDLGRVVSILPGTTVTLGRSDECTVKFDDSSLSRVHARVSHLEGTYVLKDMTSTNGSFVNDARVDFATPLADGDRIRLGTSTTLRFALVDPAEEEAMRRMYDAAQRDRMVARFASMDEREALHEDLLEAQEFQRRALAAAPVMPGLAVEAGYRPLDLVGGDIYHLSKLGDRKLRIFLADATGHGVKASLATMVILGEYEKLKDAHADPAAALAELNERIATSHAHLAVRFTATCLDVDLDRRELSWSAAAHPPSWIVAGDSVVELETGGTFMGIMAGLTFPSWSAPLAVGSCVVVSTDGVTEASGAGGTSFGPDRMADALRDAVARGPGACDALFGALDSFVAPGKLDDDATVILVRVSG